MRAPRALLRAPGGSAGTHCPVAGAHVLIKQMEKKTTKVTPLAAARKGPASPAKPYSRAVTIGRYSAVVDSTIMTRSSCVHGRMGGGAGRGG